MTSNSASIDIISPVPCDALSRVVFLGLKASEAHEEPTKHMRKSSRARDGTSCHR